MKFLVNFSIRQPVLVNLVTVGIFIVGILAWQRMPREIFPEIPRDTVVITTLYPGVAPSEVENLVTIPIERAVATVDDVETITTESSEGRSVVVVQLKEGLDDPQKVFLDVQSAVARVSNLPADLPLDPDVRGLKRQIPVMWLALSAELPEGELRALANDLKEDLEEIEGVSEASVYGIRKLQITIEVDPVKLAAHGLSIAEVMSAVRRKHRDVSGGSIKTRRGEYLIRTVGRFAGAKGVRSVVVRSGPRGVVRVKDVATVTEGFEERTQESRVYGRPSAYGVVYKNEEADAIRVTARVREYLDETKDRYPRGAGVVVLWDSSINIERRQETMYENGLMGLALVILLLFVFLDWRMALVTALGIPVAFFGAFILMHWVFGATLNMVSMFALIMVLGMLVDDAIIVVENFYRHLMMGRSRLMAALLGCREVVWPVLAAVVTTVVAYFMLTQLPGRMGQVLAVMPLVAMAALGVSLIEALFILPSHVREFAKRQPGAPRPSKEEELRILERADRGELDGPLAQPSADEPGHDPGREGAHEARWFLAFQGGFCWLLHQVVRFWYVSLPVILVGMALTVRALFGSLEYRPFPQTTVSRVDIGLELAVGTKLERTRETVRVLEKALAELPRDAVEAYICDVGRIRLRRRQTRYGSHLARCQIRLAKDGKGTLSAREVLGKLRPVLRRLPFLEKYEVARQRSGPDAGEPIQIEVRGNDDRVIQRIAKELVAYGRTIRGVEDLRADVESGKRELRVKVNEKKAAELGLDVATVGTAVRNAFGGGLATRLQRGEDEIDVMVRFPDRLRRSTADIEALLIRTPTGAMVPFKAVASITEGVGPATLRRVDRRRTVTLYGSVNERIISANDANEKLEAYAEGLRDRFPGYVIRAAGEQEEAQKLQEGIQVAFWMGLLLIFIILAAVFRSVLQPLVILFALPFAAFGVVMGLWVHGLPMTLIGALGAVALLGIVVNDSLVLVDFVNKARQRGMSIVNAAVDGGTKRLRPILLTTITTNAGLLPLAMGWFGSEEFLAPMAITIVWGLTFATLGTLVVVPCTVVWADIIRRSAFLAVGRDVEEGVVPSYLGPAINAVVLGLAAAAVTRLPWALLSVVAGIPAVVLAARAWAALERWERAAPAAASRDETSSEAAPDDAAFLEAEARRRSRAARIATWIAVVPWLATIGFVIARGLYGFLAG